MKYNEIKTHEIACQFLERDATAMPDVSMRPAQQQGAIISIIKLMDIAEAINKADDNYVPDFNDDSLKWYPVFDGSEGFAFSASRYVDWAAPAHCGSRLCFRKEEIADFFGEQFNDLHKKVLIVNR